MTFSILVCVKTVPDLSDAGSLAIRDHGIDETTVQWCINPYDAYALEAALAIRDANANVTVDALSAGPEYVRSTIRRAVAMGADEGTHLVMTSTGFTGTGNIAQAIANHAREKKYDLILAGAVSEDLMQGITGPRIAASLDWPCAAGALEITVDTEGGALAVTCEMESGMAASAQLFLPALVTVQTGEKTPRYPSLSNTLRSRRQPIQQVVPRKTEPRPKGVKRIALAHPQPTVSCEIIQGSTTEKADKLLRLFNNKGWLK